MPLTRLQSLLESQYWGQARKEVERLLSADLSPLDTGRAFRGGCLAALQCGEYYAAINMGERALRWAQETGDRQTETEVEYLIGTAFLFIGDYHLAEQHLVRFLDQSGETPALAEHLPRAHYNLGTLAEYRQNYHDAIAGYELALAHWLQSNATKGIVRCYRSLAWCHMLLGDTDAALPHLNRIEMQLRVRDEPEFRFWLLIDKAYYNRLLGRIPDSLALCEEAFAQSAAVGMSDNHLAEAAWITGENSLDVGRTHEARIFAELARKHAQKADWPFMMSRASDLLRRAAEADQRQTMDD